MATSGSISLSEVSEHTAVLRVACNRCERAGRYNLDTLIARHGAAFGIPELLRLLFDDCPKRKRCSRIRHGRTWTNQCEASKVIATNPTPLGVEALLSRQCAAQGGSVMLNKTWTFALALALAAAPISSLLAAGEPNGENATAGTAAANASTPSAKTDPAGAKPSSPEAGDPAASNTGSAGTSTTREPVNNK
jgi:hypothetical protein